MNDQTMVSTGWSPAKLLIRQGMQVGQEITLSQDAAVLGREAGLEITIQDPEMSRRHARISWQQDGYVLEDLGSTNGTTLNGTQIREPHTLHTGDSIGVGQTILEFMWQEAAQPQPAVYAPVETEPATFQAPPAPPSPGTGAAAPEKKKKSKCLLYGCGCLVVLALLVVIALVLVMLLMPGQIQPFFDENGVPIQLIGSLTAPNFLLV